MKQEQLQLTGGAGKEKRRELDFYPTPKNVTIALMEKFNGRYINANTVIWEPASGNGAMSDVLSLYCHKCIGTDIIHGQDFFKTHIECDAIITNPPFNESADFIKKAIKEAPFVAMLLKSQYWHAKNRADLFYENPPAYVLPLTWRPDFLEHYRKPGDKKGAPTMEVSWSVWIKGDNETKYLPLLKPQK